MLKKSFFYIQLNKFLTTFNNIIKKTLIYLFLFLILFSAIFSCYFYRLTLKELFAETEYVTFDSSIKDNSINISAESAIIMDFDTGKILWEKNSNKRLYPASTTKMLTAIIAIENIKNLNEIVNISKNASGRNSSFFAFRAGDKITLLDLLKAALIISHNNATVALAEYVCGSEAKFVELMNEKAKEIGAYNSTFQNTNGLDTNYPEHKTTAKDLATIASYCLKNNLFKKIVNTRKDIITINGEKIEIKNTNFLLSFGYIKGVKTGFTDNAGGCLVAYSEHKGLNLISVVLNSQKGSREVDILKLINWAENNFSNKKIIDSKSVYNTISLENFEDDKNIKHITILNIDIYPQNDFEKLINNSDKIEIKDNINDTNDIEVIFPLKENKQVGKLSLFINNEKQADINLIIKDYIEKPSAIISLSKEYAFKQIKIIIILLAFYFLIIIFIIFKNLFVKR